ncbi:hypothetical protein DBR32_01370 [Taibaiella sp. KBW10]|uniref:lytic transglycosylase domain-containing protein n=1 Tax=Taibaiella sp. KBW10 TaxID=2153357 RepID=UPI000F59AC92|nr:lytic transglycosylase domain-containing protein [Taibaiella sp. KBW10]RQO32288.1 hypothetical protein DBR32_01370 [Taibaiella sp. KBW10]
MPWKKIFCAVMMYVPSVTFAQKKVKEDNKPIAENAIPMKTAAPKPLEKTALPATVTPSGAKITTTPVAATAHKLTERSRKEKGDQYVPIAGEMAYFGKNNEYVLNYVKNYYQSNIKHFNTIKQRSNRYFKIIDRTFDRREVPLELKYLCVIESAFNNNAESPVGAVGPWQFMPTTGQFMGLVVNGKVDERRDWGKSTNAAAKYVNYLYDQLQDWLLVVAAYNSGPRPVINAIKKTGKSDFFAIKKYLPAETQNHVMAFIATATVMERMDNYIGGSLPDNFNWKWLNVGTDKPGGAVEAVPEKPKNPLLLRFSEAELKTMSIVEIKKPIDMDVLASVLQVDRRLLGRWNYDFYSFVDDFNAGEKVNFNLRIPKDKLDVFLEKKDYIERQKVDLNTF